MEPPDPVAKLRHSLANPLAALLAEVQLLLMDGESLDESTRHAMREVERLAIRMRTILRDTGDAPG
jgi:light-regulated signal transduction histidine kinase (bacteriophytochrome)